MRARARPCSVLFVYTSSGFFALLLLHWYCRAPLTIIASRCWGGQKFPFPLFSTEHVYGWVIPFQASVGACTERLLICSIFNLLGNKLTPPVYGLLSFRTRGVWWFFRLYLQGFHLSRCPQNVTQKSRKFKASTDSIYPWLVCNKFANVFKLCSSKKIP